MATLFKKNSLGPWGPRSKEILAAFERARGGTLEEVYGFSLLADSALTHQEAEYFPIAQLRVSKSPRMSRTTLYPDVWAAWERNPKTIELSDDAVAQFELYEGDVESATFDRLFDLFPGCLLIDTAPLGKECLHPGSVIKGVFVFPSIDVEHMVFTLRYVALLGEEIESATSSYLHLDGETIGESRRLTKSRDEHYWESTNDGPIDFATGLGRAVMMDQHLLNELVDRILALFLSDVYVAEQTMSDGVCHIKLRTASEVETGV